MTNRFVATSLLLVFGGCSSEPPAVALSGSLEKGPLIRGSQVAVVPVNDSATQRGEVVFTRTIDDAGRFEVQGDLDGLVALVGDGRFFVEISGAVSSTSITLRAYHSITSATDRTVRVNVVTRLIHERVRRLLESGMPATNAIPRAEQELREGLQLGPAGFDPGVRATRMSILGGDTDANAYLLAVSSVVLEAASRRGGILEDDLEQILSGVAKDLGDDGLLDIEWPTELGAAERTLDTAMVRQHLMVRLLELELDRPPSVPDLDRIVDTDGDEVANAFDNCPRVSNPGQEDTFSNGIGDACDDSVLAPTFAQQLGRPNPELDILFVVDSSGRMAPRQERLVASFPALEAMLASQEGGMPSLHIGVISTDLGTGFQQAGCSESGHDGRLLSEPQIPDCSPPQGRFIQDLRGPDGIRDRNYTGSLTDTFACVASLGERGCGFEQPLEAMRLALDGSRPDNAGFSRGDAILAIIFLTDEDDCSTRDRAMFDPFPDAGDLGPAGSYRCTEFGVVCSPDTPRVPGVYQSCHQRADSTYMFGVGEYVEFIQDIKAGRPLVFITTIAGPGGTANTYNREATVSLDSGGAPQLDPTCADDSGSAVPAFRLGPFAGAFGLETGLSSVCAPSFAPALERLAAVLASAASGTCLVAEPLPGTCVVKGGATELFSCPQPAGQPCFELVEDSTSCETPPGIEVDIDWAGQTPSQELEIRCSRAP
jgi:hypothetical protein